MSRAFCGARLQVVVLLCSWPAAVRPQALPEVAPATIGLSAEGVRALDSLMAGYTVSDRFPALMLMIARNGKIGYWKAAGVRDRVRQDPLERNDVFRVYSITKPITATAIMMLWEEGKLRLDDPVERYVPPFKGIRVYAGPGVTRPPTRPLTIRHLLTFSAGMTYGTLGVATGADSLIAREGLFVNARGLDDLMRRLAELPLIGNPGDSLSYGFQTDVLGKIVEVVSGMRLDRFFQDRIFGPLEMRETAFELRASQLGRYPTLYGITAGKAPQVLDPGDGTSTWALPLDQRKESRFLSGGGGLVSTPADYIRFLQMLANRGQLEGVRLLKQATVDTMTAAHRRDKSLRVASVQGPGWATGFQVMVAPDIKEAGGGGHDGLYWMSGAANLFVWVDPASQVAGMAWTQVLPYRVFPIFEDTRRVVHSVLKD
jgi:CubicO group peptidase (beta-lactamase class C family)